MEEAGLRKNLKVEIIYGVVSDVGISVVGIAVVYEKQYSYALSGAFRIMCHK